MNGVLEAPFLPGATYEQLQIRGSGTSFSAYQYISMGGAFVQVSHDEREKIELDAGKYGISVNAALRAKYATPYYVVLPSLGEGQPRLRKAIVCTIEQVGIGNDNYIATFQEANLFASGDTMTEAAENLMDIIASKYQMFSQQPDKLGDLPKRQLSILRKYIHD